MDMTMNRLIILISADAEWQALGELLPEPLRHSSPYGEWIERQSGGKDLIFFHGGWGKIAAAGSTQYAIDRWQPDLLVNLGTCGGFEGEIERGEIILVERTVVYDIVEKMGDYQEHIAAYSTNLDLSWLGDDLPATVRRTLLVSADRDLLSHEIPGLKQEYGAVAGDWESGAIAWVAARNGVRCLILRGVTDLVGESGGEAYGNLDAFRIATRGLMGKLLEMLESWLRKL
jgi:adenosylhomocysteine nucleosidase